MSDLLHIENHGPLIVASNFWRSEMAALGLLYLSVNAGAFRLLVPASQRAMISDMRAGARHVVVSMLAAAQWQPAQYAVEWMVEDGTDEPWICHLSPGQIDRGPSAEDVGRQFIASVWDEKKGRAHKCLERPAYLQIVPSLPWLRRIGQMSKPLDKFRVGQIANNVTECGMTLEGLADELLTHDGGTTWLANAAKLREAETLLSDVRRWLEVCQTTEGGTLTACADRQSAPYQ